MTTDLTTEQMRIEVCLWMYPETDPAFRKVINIHDLPALTLDWLHECERKLSPDQFIDYVDSHLCDITSNKDQSKWSEDTGWTPAMVHATAEQRLEALYRTIKTP